MIATAAPVESSSSDLLSTGYIKVKTNMIHLFAVNKMFKDWIARYVDYSFKS